MVNCDQYQNPSRDLSGMQISRSVHGSRSTFWGVFWPATEGISGSTSIGRATETEEEVRAMPTHVGVALIGTILFAISVIFRVWV